MKAIQLRNTKIEIPFQDADGNTLLTLYFDRGDDNVKRLYASFEELKKRADELEKSGKDEDIDETYAFVKETMDSILGKDSFNKVYEISPSTTIIVIYLYQIALGIKAELEEEDIKAVEAKYLE